MEVKSSADAHCKQAKHCAKQTRRDVIWQKAGQEEVDELWKEVPSREENEVMGKSGIEGEERKHTSEPQWKEEISYSRKRQKQRKPDGEGRHLWPWEPDIRYWQGTRQEKKHREHCKHIWSAPI